MTRRSSEARRSGEAVDGWEDAVEVGLDEDGFRPWGVPISSVASEMSNDAVPVPHPESLEVPVAELLRRARPLPPLGEMVIDDLTDEEAEAFLAAFRS